MADHHVAMLMHEPDALLALSLSVPYKSLTAPEPTTLQVSIDEDQISIHIPRGNARHNRSALVLASKETIGFAILLRKLWETRYEHNTLKLMDDLRMLAWTTQETMSSEEGTMMRELLWPERRAAVTKELAEVLRIDSDSIREFDDAAIRAFNILEEQRLIVDPAITATTGIMVLLGLMPVRWSVRTPKGQEVYREIKVHAGLWSLNIQKRRRGGKKFVDWSFDARGVNIIRKLLLEFAKEYVEGEHQLASRQGRPTTKTPDEFTIDPEDE
jgi:hypothetical protein